MLAQVAQEGCGCPSPDSVQSQVGQGLEPPELHWKECVSVRPDGTIVWRVI